MEIAHYLKALNAVHQIPRGLSAYLSHSLNESLCAKHMKIGHAEGHGMYLANIGKGSAKLYAVDKETHEEHIIEFFLPGDFLPTLTNLPSFDDQQLFIEFLEDSSVLSINEKHFSYLPKLFSECTLLYHKIYFTHFLSLLKRSASIKALTAEERFQKLLLIRPSLFNLASVKDLASYLSMHPNTLSMLKAKK